MSDHPTDLELPPPIPEPEPVATSASPMGVRLRDNPVLRRELIERVRGAKAVVFLTIWLLLLTGILVLAYQGAVAINDGFGGAIVRESPLDKLSAARRKAITLKFARAAADRVMRAGED